MNAMLEKFRKAKEAEILFLRQLAGKGELPAPFAGQRPSFIQALTAPPLAIIAEYKRASPSRGSINLSLEPEDVALLYANAGASAISVLTEVEYFKGDIGFLERMTGACLPLLRKDFIVTAEQVTATAATPASAMLLITRMLDAQTLADLVRQCEDYGMVPVVEVFDETDLHNARNAGARVLQVNNRDLDSLKTDFQTCLRLVRQKVEGEVWIAASGIDSAGQIAALRQHDFDAALVGTSLMSAASPGEALRNLLEG